ncbi:MAG: hypothetical protein ACRDGT_13170 [Candidatus Limnocylindria bacterium]
MSGRLSTGLLAALVLALSVAFAALTIADAAEHAPTASGFTLTP